MNKEVAGQIVNLMVAYYAKLNVSVKLVQDNCSVDEFEAYRKAIANIMADMSDIMLPIFRQYPDLEPPEFKT